ncbi:MAG: ABC transporter permease [Nitrospirota bacterium]|jgi:putative ABC transport system permease protein
MKALDRKLLRDMWRMKGQALAIAIVIVSGVSTFVMSLSTLDSLRRTRTAYYQDYRFGDVFMSLKRAPESMRKRIREIPEVEMVETRVVVDARLEVGGFGEPITGRIVSVPDSEEPLLNRLYFRQGRYPAPGRDDEVVVSESFAKAHSLRPGENIGAIINGRKETFTIVGIALSPEFIYQLKPGTAIPDFKRYGILWMGRKPLSTAYDLEGAFNDVVLTLSAGAQAGDAIDRLDSLFEPYGGLGAYGREDQVSYRYLHEEFRQLGNMATIFPIIFLAVAAFLLNVVINRVVSIQREQAAALKAFGYSNAAIGVHYIKLVIVVVLAGVAGGTLVGAWMGKGLSELYMDYYKFPFLDYVLRPGIFAIAILVSVSAAVAGTVYSIWRASVYPPAQAMRPEPPTTYRETFFERLGLKRFLSQPTRMIARHIERRPLKSLLTVIGIAFACAILMFGSFFEDAINFMVDVQFGLAEREDITVSFFEPASRGALFELNSLPGVEYGEAYRSVPARLRHEHRSYRTSVLGVEPGGDLYRLLDDSLEPFDAPPEGIMLTDHLGKILGAGPGDTVTVEVLEGSRPERQVTVSGLVSQYVGVSGYMRLGALNRMMREGHAISGARLAVDSKRLPEIYDALNGMPRVASTENRRDAVRNFRETLSEQVLLYALIITVLAGTIAFGVVYNSMRIALSERGRELASLRVLGFTRGEISYILLGELAILTLAAIPVGFIIGNGLCAYIVTKLSTDLFRVPLVVEPSTYAFSASVVLGSAAVSGLIVKRKLDKLDLVAVLKTKE